MANNRTGRGVLILICILALIVAGIYFERRNPHPLDIEAGMKAEAVTAEPVDTTRAPHKKKSEKRRRAKPAKKRSQTGMRPQPEALPSPHDAPVSPITE